MAKKIESKFSYVPSKRESKAMSRCNNNRITIYPIPYGSLYKLVRMRADGHKQIGKQTFNMRTDEWYQKIFEIYLILEKTL